MSEIEPKHPPADMAGLDGLIELLAAKREYYVAGAVMQEWVNPDGPVAATQLQALKAENERLLDALFDAIALIGHVVPMETTALIGGEKLTARNVWQAGHDLMFPKRTALERIDRD